MTQDSESDFFASAKLVTFTDADTWAGAKGNNCLAESRKGKARGAGTGKDKLVDVTTIRNKFIIKTNSLAMFARTALKEAIEAATTYFADESDFCKRFQGWFMASQVCQSPVQVKSMVG